MAVAILLVVVGRSSDEMPICPAICFKNSVLRSISMMMACKGFSADLSMYISAWNQLFQ